MRNMPVAICGMMLVSMTPLFAARPQNAVANFTLTSPSNIPGSALQAGTYTIHIVNSLSDRSIVQVDSANGNFHSTFIGIPNDKLPGPSDSGLVDWAHSTKGAGYLRGWHVPGTSSSIEFVYPKAEAVAIANSNQEKVPAIDPASEGLAVDSSLSQRDMQLVTLWLLSAERIGPTDHAPSIKAERYEQVAANTQKPVISSLPHTGSPLPWLWLLSAFSILSAAILHLFRARIVSRSLSANGKP